MNTDDLVLLHSEESSPCPETSERMCHTTHTWFSKYIKFLKVVHCQKCEGKGWYTLSSFSAEVFTNGNNSSNSWKSGN